MAQLKNVVLASAILFVCNFAAADQHGIHWTQHNGTAIINRTRLGNGPPGFYLGEIDRTAFVVNRDILLQRLDIAPIFKYDSERPTPLKHNYLAIVKVLETDNNGYVDTLSNVNATINSVRDSELYFYPELQLKRNSSYEIRIQFPKDFYFLYKDNLEVKEYQVNVPINGAVRVRFSRKNPHMMPPNSTDMLHKHSTGAVKRLHLVY